MFMYEELMFLLPLLVFVFGSIYLIKYKINRGSNELNSETSTSVIDEIDNLKKELNRVSEELKILKNNNAGAK